MSEGQERPSGHSYRVLKAFPWIEGGRPALRFEESTGRMVQAWEGGRHVGYEPGETVYMEDEDAACKWRCLEAIDDAGRAVLEVGRERSEQPIRRIPTADLYPEKLRAEGSPSDLVPVEERRRELLGLAERLRAGEPISAEDRELLARLAERTAEKDYPEWPSELPPGIAAIEREWATRHDGTAELFTDRRIPENPLPDVVYGDNGRPDRFATAARRAGEEKERKRREMESTLAAVKRGGKRGGERGRETRRDNAAREREALRAAVTRYRKQHPDQGRPAIAEALFPVFGRIRDRAEPKGRERAIQALTKRVERLEKKPLDT